jgi:hypothetical protein
MPAFSIALRLLTAFEERNSRRSKSTPWENIFYHSNYAVVDAITHIYIETPRLTKQGFVARGPAAMALAWGFIVESMLSDNLSAAWIKVYFGDMFHRANP